MNTPVTAGRTMNCPYCKKEIPLSPDPKANPFRPFCSQRCKLADLGAWASGRYAVPVVDTDDIDDLGYGDEGGSPDGQNDES